MTVHRTHDQAAHPSASAGRECVNFCPRCQRGGLRFARVSLFLHWKFWLGSLKDRLRPECTATSLAYRAPIALRLQALQCARLLAAEPSIEQQVADAEVLAIAMDAWASEPRLRSHVYSVFVTACAEAESALQAMDLAARVFRFLVADEVGSPAAEGA